LCCKAKADLWHGKCIQISKGCFQQVERQRNWLVARSGVVCAAQGATGMQRQQCRCRKAGKGNNNLTEISLRSGVWYGEEIGTLQFPDTWDLNVLWPKSSSSLSREQIIHALERPVGQPSIRELCKGKSSPLIVVDDPNRPTPVNHILPIILEQFRQAGVECQKVRVLIATGTHAAPRPETLQKKIGPEAFATCRIMVHDAKGHVAKVGISSFGTPVEVNREVLQSDFVIGIGGIYPNHTAGYGGGSKLALGVLGFRTIRRLHYAHAAAGWCDDTKDWSFRRDLDEISRMIGLHTIVSAQVNADRGIIRVDCGDPRLYFDSAVAFCRETFTTPEPGEADVVVSNAYPNDLSLTFVTTKGMTPLYHCAPTASRIVVAACSEGFGHHGLFPLAGRSWISRQYQVALRVGMIGPQRAAQKVIRRLGRQLRTGLCGKWPSVPRNPVRLYQPRKDAQEFEHHVSWIQAGASWEEILRGVTLEQDGKKQLRVVVYPCAPLQVLQPSTDSLKQPPQDETKSRRLSVRSAAI
jgi:nickel-dependent lactate racemase